jgi:hypothetical protein
MQENEVPHGTANYLTNAWNEDIGGFGDAGIVGVRLHIKRLDRTGKVSENNRFTNGIDHESFGGCL